MPRLSGSLRKTCLVALLGFSSLACGSTSSLTPTQPSPANPATTISTLRSVTSETPVPSVSVVIPEPVGTKATFKVAVIVDTLSEPVAREQAQGVFDEANMLIEPFAAVGLEMVDFVEDGGGGTTKDLAGRYLASHTAAGANGILIFSFGDSGQAKLHDGYGYAIPTGTRNAFVSPVGGANQIYVAVVRFGLKYMACGYGSKDTVQSSTAVDGECHNKPGTACVQNNGYSMCANAVGNLYTSPPNHFVASTVLHAFLHSFSPGSDKDDYATPECNARMGYPAGFFDLQESQYYNGICPFVYEDFAAAYQP